MKTFVALALAVQANFVAPSFPSLLLPFPETKKHFASNPKNMADFASPMETPQPEDRKFNDLVNGLLHELTSEQPRDAVEFLTRKLSSSFVGSPTQVEKQLYPKELTLKPLTIIVLGASGDLAKKKTFPAIFKLYQQRLLPPHARIVGYARSEMTLPEFHDRVTQYIKEDTTGFKTILSYVSGQYDSAEDMGKLDQHVKTLEKGAPGGGNRVFYLALPPTQFVSTCRSIHASAVPTGGWIRVVVEKPFGSDTASSNALSKDLSALFREDQIFRIDHYLGKEMVQNLVTLRFANHIFGAVWNRSHISNVQITFKETIGTEGRGGYFDSFGIIRDVIQNHLTQILALVAMEKPKSLSAEHVRDEKVSVLQCVRPIAPENVVLGQYGRSPDGKKEGYLDDPTVPKGSTTPTFASLVLFIENDRWQDVPFIIKAGKAMDRKMVTVRVQFRDEVRPFGDRTQRNELVIRMQPDEAMYLKVSTKVPGVSQDIQVSELDLSYHQRFKGLVLPEAYESLINEVVLGNSTNFVRSDELQAAWEIFTPILHNTTIPVRQYPFGSRGPQEADDLATRFGFKRTVGYEWAGHSKV
jgi:glucose-6-phosphate 1-dehydrogenase